MNLGKLIEKRKYFTLLLSRKLYQVRLIRAKIKEIDERVGLMEVKDDKPHNIGNKITRKA